MNKQIVGLLSEQYEISEDSVLGILKHVFTYAMVQCSFYGECKSPIGTFQIVDDNLVLKDCDVIKSSLLLKEDEVYKELTDLFMEIG